MNLIRNSPKPLRLPPLDVVLDMARLPQCAQCDKPVDPTPPTPGQASWKVGTYQVKFLKPRIFTSKHLDTYADIYHDFKFNSRTRTATLSLRREWGTYAYNHQDMPPVDRRGQPLLGKTIKEHEAGHTNDLLKIISIRQPLPNITNAEYVKFMNHTQRLLKVCTEYHYDNKVPKGPLAKECQGLLNWKP